MGGRFASETEIRAAEQLCVPDPKPVKRIVDRATYKRALWFTYCRICAAGEPVDAHHLVPRSLGGDDIFENLVVLCRKHHGLIEARDPQTCGRLRGLLSDGQIGYIVTKKGQDFLDRYYPEAVA